MYLWNFVFVIFPWSRLLNAAYNTDDWGLWRPYDVVPKFSSIFNGPDASKLWKNKQSRFFNQLAIMLTGCLWIKFHWEKNTLVSLYLACDDDICNWRRNQSMEFWSKDISLMLPPPTFGKRVIIANFWLAKSWKIIEFALVRPSPKNPKSRADLITFVISRIT